MTDRDMTRTDWLNESYCPSDHDMETADAAVREEVANLLSSLIAIAPAVSMSELNTAIRRLNECEAYSPLVNSAIVDACETIVHYRDRLLKGVGTFNAMHMAEDLAMNLQDFE